MPNFYQMPNFPGPVAAPIRGSGLLQGLSAALREFTAHRARTEEHNVANTAAFLQTAIAHGTEQGGDAGQAIVQKAMEGMQMLSKKRDHKTTEKILDSMMSVMFGGTEKYGPPVPGTMDDDLNAQANKPGAMAPGGPPPGPDSTPPMGTSQMGMAAGGAPTSAPAPTAAAPPMPPPQAMAQPATSPTQAGAAPINPQPAAPPPGPSAAPPMPPGAPPPVPESPDAMGAAGAAGGAGGVPSAEEMVPPTPGEGAAPGMLGGGMPGTPGAPGADAGMAAGGLPPAPTGPKYKSDLEARLAFTQYRDGRLENADKEQAKALQEEEKKPRWFRNYKQIEDGTRRFKEKVNRDHDEFTRLFDASMLAGRSPDEAMEDAAKGGLTKALNQDRLMRGLQNRELTQQRSWELRKQEFAQRTGFSEQHLELARKQLELRERIANVTDGRVRKRMQQAYNERERDFKFRVGEANYKRLRDVARIGLSTDNRIANFNAQTAHAIQTGAVIFNDDKERDTYLAEQANVFKRGEDDALAKLAKGIRPLEVDDFEGDDDGDDGDAGDASGMVATPPPAPKAKGKSVVPKVPTDAGPPAGFNPADYVEESGG